MLTQLCTDLRTQIIQAGCLQVLVIAGIDRIQLTTDNIPVCLVAAIYKRDDEGRSQ